MKLMMVAGITSKNPAHSAGTMPAVVSFSETKMTSSIFIFDTYSFAGYFHDNYYRY